VSTRGDSSWSHGKEPNDDTANLQNDDGNYNKTAYNADRDTTTSKDDTDEESDDGQNHIILLDNENSIVAAAVSILVAESKQ